MKQKIIYFGLFLITLVGLSGCRLWQDESISFLEKPTEQTLIAESFLPKDTVFFAKFTRADSNQDELLKTLLSNFPPEYKQNLTENLENFAAFYGLDFETEIKPLLDPAGETLFAWDGNFDFAPGFYLIQKIKSPAAYVVLKTKLQQSEKVTVLPESLKLKTPLPYDLYLGHKDNFLLLTNRQESLTSALDLAPADSIVYQSDYRNVRGNLPEDFNGIFFFNAHEFNAKTQNSQTETASRTSTTNLLSWEWLPFFTAIGGVIQSTSQGLKIKTYAPNDQSNIDKLSNERDFDYLNKPEHKLSLDAKLPGENLLFYFENYDFTAQLERFEQKLAFQAPAQFQIYQTQKQVLLDKFDDLGLDFSKNILPWLDRGFAFSVQGGEKLLPYFTIAVDVSSDPTQALNILNLVDELLSIAKLSLKEYAPAIEKQTIAVGKQDFNQIKLLTENLPLELQEDAEPVVTLLEDFQINYGITEDNLLVVTTNPQFSDAYNQIVVTQTLSYQAILDNLDYTRQGVCFLAPQAILEKIQTISAFLRNYRTFTFREKNVLKTLTSFGNFVPEIGFANRLQDDSEQTEIFLQIQE